jgi:hypothetical protein
MLDALFCESEKEKLKGGFRIRHSHALDTQVLSEPEYHSAVVP